MELTQFLTLLSGVVIGIFGCKFWQLLYKVEIETHKSLNEHLHGEAEIRKDGLYVGDVKVKGVTKYTTTQEESKDIYTINIEAVVLKKDLY